MIPQDSFSKSGVFFVMEAIGIIGDFIWGYIGVVGLYWGYMGIMDKKMETTLGYIEFGV